MEAQFQVLKRSKRKGWAQLLDPGEAGGSRGPRYPAELSGSQQQRVAIARALAMDRRSCCSMSRRRARPQPWSVLPGHEGSGGLGHDDGVVTHEDGFAREVANQVNGFMDSVIVEGGRSRRRDR